MDPKSSIARSQHAAVNHIQRFGGSLNLNLHFHAVIADGVFAPDDAGKIGFYGLAPPSGDMLERVGRRVRDRSLRWLRKRGLLDPGEAFRAGASAEVSAREIPRRPRGARQVA